MKTNGLIGLCFLLSGVCLACNQTKETNHADGLEAIPIEKAYLSPTTLKASDYFRKIRYVPLETSDQALIGNNPTVWVCKDRLIVSSSQKQCFAFDKTTGRFVASIGHIGNDPEGSMSLSGWLNAAAGYIYFLAGNGRSVMYDINGNFAGVQKDLDMTDGLYGIDTYDYLDADILVKHLPATDKKPDRVILFRDSTLLASFPSHGELSSPLSGAMADIEYMNVYKHSDMGHDVIYMRFKDGRQNCLLPSEQVFWHLGEDLLFRETFNDTIFRVDESGLIPVRRFDFGAMRWNREDRYDPEKDHAIYPLDVYENDRMLWLRFVVNLYHPEQWKVYNAVYDKRDKKVKVAAFDEGMRDDINNFLPLQPSFVTPSGEFAQIVSARTVLEWFEENPTREEWPQEIMRLREVEEEDNPIVILME